MLAILTETLFISNPNEAKLLKLDDFIENVAIAHSKGIAAAAGLKRKANPNQPSKKLNHLSINVLLLTIDNLPFFLQTFF